MAPRHLATVGGALELAAAGGPRCLVRPLPPAVPLTQQPRQLDDPTPGRVLSANGILRDWTKLFCKEPHSKYLLGSAGYSLCDNTMNGCGRVPIRLYL